MEGKKNSGEWVSQFSDGKDSEGVDSVLAIQAKAIASKFSRELGFVNRAALEKAEQIGELEVIPKIGFCNYHHRRDGQTTIYEIAIAKPYQRQGWGRLLFYRILCAAIERGQTSVFAKCPVDLDSNEFYRYLGFELERTELGRKRSLNCWRYPIKLPLLFYCGSGGGSKYDAIASEEGWQLGIRSCGKYKAHRHMEMIDNEWKNYSHDRHLTTVKANKPLIATAKDIEQPEQLGEILEQARELSQYCGRVLLIPKCKVPLPVTGYWLAFSVPTQYGGTEIECSWFGDCPCHLLGGSPDAQAAYAKHLNAVSLDGNYACNLARYGKSCWQGNSGGSKEVGGNYNAFRLSLDKQRRYWRKSWSWEDEPLGRLYV